VGIGPTISPPSDDSGEFFGSSIAVSGDGTTAIISDPADAGDTVAAWVYASNGARWSEVQKLTGVGSATGSDFGDAIALSGDGSSALISGIGDNGGTVRRGSSRAAMAYGASRGRS
jgi:hypothetical protein